MAELFLRLICSCGLLSSEVHTRDGQVIAASSIEFPGPALREGVVQRKLSSGEPIESSELKEYGRFLGGLAFPLEIAASIADLIQAGPVRLVLDVGRNLLDVPWELSYVATHDLSYIALHPLVRLSRVSEGRPLEPSSPPLAALLACSNPQSSTYPGLASCERELESIRRAFTSPECRAFTCREISHATPRMVEDALRAGQCTLFHFIGHGDLTPTGGVLVLEGARPHTHECIFADDFAEMLQEAGVQLAFLSGCLTGGSSNTIAGNLVSKGIPAVVAMQMPIADSDAHLFARTFYAALVDGFSLEEAVYEGRTAIRAAGQSWAAPILLTSDPGAALLTKRAGSTLIARGNLPKPLTSYIGRSALIADQVQQVQRERMVILHGSGGIGKTRLSIEIARGAEAHFQQGTWQVLLEDITTNDQVIDAVAKVFGIRDASNRSIEDRLLEFLADQSLLLILDNCEHVVPGSRSLARLILTHCPGVHILATSRETLGTGVESIVSVPPLSYPEFSAEQTPELSHLSAAAEYEAIELLVQRGKQAKSGFQLTPENVEPVGRICGRLDGIPLAIELAASRFRTFAPAQVLKKLISDPAFLELENAGKVERQRTLRATLDWSYRLLSPDEALLFNRLGLFRGSFSLEAVERVAADASLPAANIPELLSRLVDKSLVTCAEGRFEMRYRLLDTCRTYALDHLAPAEMTALKDRDLENVGRVVKDAWTKAEEGRQEEWAAQMRAEHEGIMAALEWGVQSGQVEKAAQIAYDAYPYWATIGNLGESSRITKKILAGATEIDEPLRIKLMMYAGALAFFGGDRSFYADMVEAYALVRSNHPNLIRFAAQVFGPCAFEAQDDDLALDIFNAHIADSELRGKPGGEGLVRYMVAIIQMDRGDLRAADTTLDAMLCGKRQANDIRGLGIGLCTLAHLDVLLKRAEARNRFAEGMAHLASLDDVTSFPDFLTLGAQVFVESGDFATAATILGLAERLREESGELPGRVVRTWGAATRKQVEKELGPEFERWVREGRTLGVDNAVKLFS